MIGQTKGPIGKIGLVGHFVKKRKECILGKNVLRGFTLFDISNSDLEMISNSSVAHVVTHTG